MNGKNKRGKIIAIANQKGGVAKTTTVLNFGACLAEKGYRVLLVDFDSQGNLTHCCGIRNHDALEDTIALTMKNLMRGKDDIFPNVLSCGKHEGGGVLDFIPANIELSTVKVEIIQAMAREFLLKKILKPLKERYDYILIDCAPSLDIDFINALVAADEVLIVTNPSTFSASGVEQLIKSISKVKENLNSDLTIGGVLLTRVNDQCNFYKDMKAAMRSAWDKDLRVFKTEIPLSVRVDESQSAMEPMLTYELGNAATVGYINFTAEYLDGERKTNGEKI